VHELHDFFVQSEHVTEESVKTEGSLGEKCFFGGNFFITSKGVDLTPQAGHYGKGKGMGITRKQRFPSPFLEVFPGIIGSHIPVQASSGLMDICNFPGVIYATDGSKHITGMGAGFSNTIPKQANIYIYIYIFTHVRANINSVP